MRLQTKTSDNKTSDHKLASVSFNDDLSCLACATSEG